MVGGGRRGLGFQSAPPAEARGDVQRVRAELVEYWFQSAPPAEARGDRKTARIKKNKVGFQSAPPAEARGDRRDQKTTPQPPRGFNPLPPPKRGEMRGARSTRRPFLFQSAPPAEARGDPNHYNRRNIKRLDARMRDPATLVAVRPLFDSQERRELLLFKVFTRRAKATAKHRRCTFAQAIRSADRSNSRAPSPRNVPYCLWCFHPDDRSSGSPARD